MNRLIIAQCNKALGMLICGTSNRQIDGYFEFNRPQLLAYGADAIKRRFRREIRKTWCRWHDHLYRLGKNTRHSDPECRWVDAPKDSTCVYLKFYKDIFPTCVSFASQCMFLCWVRLCYRGLTKSSKNFQVSFHDTCKDSYQNSCETFYQDLYQRILHY